MVKTPQFLEYQINDDIFIVSMHEPRFVGKLIESDNIMYTIIYDNWGIDDNELLRQQCRIMTKWYNNAHKKRKR